MAGWVALDEEATQDYLNAEMFPLNARETEHGVEVYMPHTFSSGPGYDKQCWDCGLLPLDYDRIEVQCLPTRDVAETECDECGEDITLDTVDDDGVLIGAECPCGSYVTRYMPGMEPQ